MSVAALVEDGVGVAVTKDTVTGASMNGDEDGTPETTPENLSLLHHCNGKRQ